MTQYNNKLDELIVRIYKTRHEKIIKRYQIHSTLNNRHIPYQILKILIVILLQMGVVQVPNIRMITQYRKSYHIQEQQGVLHQIARAVI